MKVIQETRRVHQIIYLRFYCDHWVDNCAKGLLVPEGNILLEDSVLAKTWFKIYNYYWNFQFLDSVIITKTKVVFHQA